jgi:hypothetical protein
VRRRRPAPDLLEELQSARLDDRPVRRAGRGPTERFAAGGAWLLLLFAGVVAVAVIAEQGKPTYPALEASCTTGALALSATETDVRGDIRYSVAGPDGDVLLAINADAVSADGVAQPSAPGAVTQVFPEEPMVGCRLRGSFPAQVPPGDHVVSAFRLVDGTWTRFASVPLTVR